MDIYYKRTDISSVLLKRNWLLVRVGALLAGLRVIKPFLKGNLCSLTQVLCNWACNKLILL